MWKFIMGLAVFVFLVAGWFRFDAARQANATAKSEAAKEVLFMGIEKLANSAERNWFEVQSGTCIDLGRKDGGVALTPKKPLVAAYESEGVFFLQYREIALPDVRSFTNSADFCRKMASVEAESKKIDEDFKERQQR
jgi:hypothetical protein